MKIKEKFIKGKFNNPDLCEDGICVTDDFVMLIDGVSSFSKFEFKNKKPGKINGNTIIENNLEVDELYKKIRIMTIKYLLETGYTEEKLL